MTITSKKQPIWANTFKSEKGKFTKYSTIISSGKDDKKVSMFITVRGKENIIKLFPKKGIFYINIKEAFLGCESYTSKGDEKVVPVLILTKATLIDEDDDDE